VKKAREPVPASRTLPARPWLLPALAAVLTLGLRLWFVLSTHGQPFSTPSPQVIDSWYYYQQALTILRGDFWGHDVFFLRPLYPYLLALLGNKVILIQLFQTLLAGLSCLMLWDVARRSFGRTAAAIAALAFGLTGILVFYTGALLYVELTVFLNLLVVWLLQVAGQRLWRWLASGVALGLLVICRPELLILLPTLVFWLWRSRVRLLYPLLMSGAALAVIATVPLRNYLVARDPVLFTAHSGINFYYGNNPEADGTWQPAGDLDRNVGFSHEQLKRVSRVIDGDTLFWSRASAHWLNKGLAFILGHPFRYLKLLGRKLLLHLSNYEVPNNYYPDPVRRASLPLRIAALDFGFALSFGIIGMFMAWRRRCRAAPLYLVVAAFLLSSLFFYVLSRLRAPVIPFLLIFAGFALSELWSALRRRQTRRLALGLGLAALVYAGSNLIPIDKRGYATQGYAQLGNVWLEMNKPAPARDAFEQALRLDSTSVSARYSMVELMAAAGRKQEAAAHLRMLARDAAGTAGGNTLVQLASARVAIAWRDFPVAVATYQTLLAQHPDNAQAWYMLGLVYTSTGDLDLAADALTRASELDPSNSDARSALQRVRARLSR